MTRTKLSVRQSYQLRPGDLVVRRIRNKNILNNNVTNARYKTKKMLPRYEVVEVKQNSRVVTPNTIRRKSYYLSGKQRVQY